MATAIRRTFEQVPDFPYLPELPARGPWAAMIGRGLGLVAGIGADFEAGVWRLAPTAGVDLRRARTTLRDDLDMLEEAAQGYTGPFKAQVTGPWTLAACVMAAHTRRVLADPGARRDVAQAVAEGVRQLVAGLRARLPGCELLVQVDEPALPAVLAGAVPTPGGAFRHTAIELPEVATALGWVAAAAAPAAPAIHCCAPGLPIAALCTQAGFAAVSLDVGNLAGPDFEALAELLEAGKCFWMGALPTGGLDRPCGVDELRERGLQTLERVGVAPPDQLALTPACGLAGFAQRDVAAAFAALRKAAAQVEEELAAG
jgi:methionine synthase II (cobalamin-independent)